MSEQFSMSREDLTDPDIRKLLLILISLPRIASALDPLQLAALRTLASSLDGTRSSLIATSGQVRALLLADVNFEYTEDNYLLDFTPIHKRLTQEGESVLSVEGLDPTTKYLTEVTRRALTSPHEYAREKSLILSLRRWLGLTKDRA